MTTKQVFETVALSNFDKLKNLIDKGYEETSDFIETVNSLSMDLENVARILSEEELVHE